MPQAEQRRLHWRPRSLQSRQLLAASMGLLAFLALAGFALDRAFVDVAGQGLRDRLKSYAYAYAGGTEFARDGSLIAPYVPPDGRFDRPGSGLYAEIVLPNDSWSSGSARGPQLPDAGMLDPLEERFEGPLPITRSDGQPGEVFRFGIGLVDASRGPDAEFPYAIYIMEDAGTLPRQVRVFRAALWRYLGIAGLILLLLQGLVLRWSLWPLRKVVAELKRVQRGQAHRMSELHPRELQPLTDSINALVESERENLEQQRNTMADLAHSLKTPLAVLRSRLENDASHGELRDEVETQVRRMNDLVSYQLGRGAAGGHKLFAAPVEIESHAEQIVRGLEKIYAAKGTVCEFEIDPAARFHGEVGDLQELLGNLLENAFKWAGSRVLLTASPGATAANRRPGLVLAVDDDGPGIPPERIAHVLQRGVRGDERVHGHGIGLSIVQDIVRSYRGELEVGPSPELGGTRFLVRLPPGL
ncbi:MULTISPECIES: sensor histidine kinase [unclassified Luteimonas]|uniref:ATP-binding protein n=1 Tax=unclassified Luteimonas TaxID=2629088 RepID=UPI0016036FCE|nr:MULTISPECIES: sensor histidine kinase [unclassified Luteimonas]MBB1473599.1 sensor histidine kinase [Luteimonas sp. MC1782]MBB6600186.1 sensor histidine kinase [Luteimonas sp. MC1825]QOC87875.1 sensor histidine kinase [Luteimonas sp. MC1825]